MDKYSYKHIIIIGMPGSGKSSLAPLIADKLKRDFYDTDILLEKQKKMSVADIFTYHGEKSFRELESACLKRLIPFAGSVIATGGGIILAKKNRPLITNNNLVIYLKASSKTLANNLGGNDTRPLIKSHLDKEKQLKEMLKLRNKVYNSCADIVVRVDKKNINDLLNEIQTKILIKKR